MNSSKPRSQTERFEEDAEPLFDAYRRTRDPRVRAQLVSMHENLVRFLAAKFANRGEPLDDLIQVGMIGLINAVDRYESSRGTRFSTYATPTIVGEIKRHFRDRAWNLKVPRWLQELNRQVLRANEALVQRMGRSPTMEEIAEHVGCSEEEALQALELGNAYETLSLDTRLAGDGDTAVTLNDSIGGQDSDLAQINAYDDLKMAMQHLDPRERTIIDLRFFQELSQTEVAERMNISQMHVSRLQSRALRRLREILDQEHRTPLRNAA